jgi:5'-nucleotidase/UDP-sugar diphosphatase
MRKLLLLAVVGYFFSSCEVLQFAPEDPIKGAGAVTIKFVQINDVYEIAPLGGGEYGGLARVAHIRDSIKEQFPNTYLFLAGDFLNPSLIGTLKVEGEIVNGKQMIDVLNAMDIDLVTFGNHEFDLSEKDLQNRLNESNFTWTTANVRHVTEKGLVPFATKWEYSTVPTSDFSTFNAIDADGNKIKFGVFGVTIPSNPKPYVSYGDIFENAERAYNLAIQKSDFVVGLTHVSIEDDKKIASRLRSLPLIMGGHEHFNMLEKEGRTIIAKADANAKSVYVHTIIYNLRTKFIHINSELMMVTDKITSSAKVERVVNKWTDLVNEKLKEVV